MSCNTAFPINSLNEYANSDIKNLALMPKLVVRVPFLGKKDLLAEA